MPILEPAIINEIKTKLDQQFGPVNPDLQPGEISQLQSFRQKLATCIAQSGIHVRDNALVAVTGVMSGAGVAPGKLT